MFKKSALIFTFFFLVLHTYSQKVIQPNLFSQNAWYINNSDPTEFDYNGIWDMVGASGAKLIRIGGIESNYNPIYTAIRSPTDGSWGIDGASFTKLTTLIGKIRSVHLEPIVQISFIPYNHPWQINLADQNNRKMLGDYQQIAALLVTKLSAYNIKYYVIGNEPDGAITSDNKGGYGITQSSIIAEYIKAISSSMKAAQDKANPIKIIGPELTYYRSPMIDELTSGGANDITGIDAAGNSYIDYFSFHTYPFNDESKTVQYVPSPLRTNVISNLEGSGGLGPNLEIWYNKKLTFRGSNDPLKLAITEANICHINDVNSVNAANGGNDLLNGNGANSFLAGQFWAEMLGISMRKGVDILNFWSIREGNPNPTDGSVPNAGNIGYINNDPKHFGGQDALKPTYHHFKMMADNFSGTYLASSHGSSLTNIKTHACKKPNGDIVLLILNQNTSSSLKFTVNLNGATTTPYFIGVAASLSNAVYSDMIPGQSTTLIIFDATGAIKEKYEYGMQDANVQTAPRHITGCSAYSLVLRNSTGDLQNTFQPGQICYVSNNGLKDAAGAMIPDKDNVNTQYYWVDQDPGITIQDLNYQRQIQATKTPSNTPVKIYFTAISNASTPVCFMTGTITNNNSFLVPSNDCPSVSASVSIYSGLSNSCTGPTLQSVVAIHNSNNTTTIPPDNTYYWLRNGAKIVKDASNPSSIIYFSGPTYNVTSPGFYSITYSNGNNSFDGSPCTTTSRTVEVAMGYDYYNGINLSGTQSMIINTSKNIFGNIVIGAGCTLTLNSNVIIGMSPGSKITVNNGGTLNINGGNIQGMCNQMWSGIEVLDGGIISMQNKNSVMDALEGVKVNNSTASIHNTIFDANLIGIHITNCWTTSNTYSGNQFNSLTALKDQTKGTAINGVNYGTTGIKIESSAATIGNDASNPNVFNSGQNGIDIYTAYVVVGQNTFNNIKRAAINDDGMNMNSQRYIKISNNTFTSCANAARIISGVPTTIVGNTINTCSEQGILWFNNNGYKLILGQVGSGLGNTFNANNWTAICTYDNSGVNTDISISNNTIVNATYGYGITVNETNVASTTTYGKLDVSNNTLSREGDGIIITNIIGYQNFSNDATTTSSVSRICNNTIAFDTEFGPYKNGIKITNSRGLNIFGNNVSTPSNTDWRTVALRLADSPNSYVNNNILKAGMGLMAQGNLINTNFACNTFDKCVDGIQLNYCYIRSVGGTHGTATNPLPNNFTNILSWGQPMELYYSDVANNMWYFLNGTNPNVLLTGNCGTGSNKLFANYGAINPCSNSIPGASYKMETSAPAPTSQMRISTATTDYYQNDPVMQWKASYTSGGTSNATINSIRAINDKLSKRRHVEAKGMIAALSISHPVEILYKSVFDILLKEDTVTKRLTDLQVEAMSVVARLNPRKAGPAVYAARSILFSERNLNFYDTEGENDGHQYKRANYNKMDMYGTPIDTASKEQGVVANLYPNPTSQGFATLELSADKDEVVSVELCDYTGKVVQTSHLQLKIGLQKIDINTADLDKGLYIVKICSLTKPLLVQKLTVL
jgi:hypothetical protein